MSRYDREVAFFDRLERHGRDHPAQDFLMAAVIAYAVGTIFPTSMLLGLGILWFFTSINPESTAQLLEVLAIGGFIQGTLLLLWCRPTKDAPLPRDGMDP